MTALRVLVCGGRSFDDRQLVYDTLDDFLYKPGISLIIEGGARGADRLGYEYASERGIPCQTFKADWDRLGRKAGPLRNIDMLEKGRPDLVVAFPGGRGTEHMISIAEKAGVRVYKITQWVA